MRYIMMIGIATLGAVALAALIATSAPASAQEDEGGSQLELRVIAQPLEDGQIEFGIEYLGEQILPTARYLTPRLIQQRRGQWLSSTPVEVVGDSLAPAALSAGPDADEVLYRDVDDLWETRGFGRAVEVVRVAAQPLADGRVEFAVEHNGERIQPEARYLTPQLIRDRQGDWLRSSPVSISAAISPAELVRAASIRAAAAGSWNSSDGTPVDVAAVCALSAVVRLSSISGIIFYGGEWESHPHLAHNVRSTLSAEHESRSDEWIMIRADEEQRASLRAKVPARNYGFLVQDVRYQAPTVWWVAEFTCGSSDEQSDGTSQNLS